MTTVVDATAAATTPGEQAAQQDARTRRGLRRGLLWGGLLLAVVATLVLVLAARPPAPSALDPESTRLAGARAVAHVLADHGVQVDVRRAIGELEDARPRAGTTVVVTAPERLGADGLGRLRAAVTDTDRLVLVAPDQRVLDGLGLALHARAGWRSAPAEPACTTALVRPGERLAGSDGAYETPSGAGWLACFPREGGGAQLVVLGSGSGHEVVVTGFAEALTNRSVLQEANAAYALRLLGHSRRLVWYHPGASDVADAGTAAPPGLVLPHWFGPLVSMLASGVVLLALVRGRRLGRVVVEPLPVVVRAVETTEGRGRLYRRAADRGHAAEVLREGTRRRLALRTGLGRHAVPAEALVAAVARAAGVPEPSVRAVLLDPVPDTDEALVGLARQLSDLEQKVARP